MEQNQTMQMYMTIRAQRDAAIQERNMALDERKRAFAERDMAMLQRDAAIAECNSAIQERDEAVAALRVRETTLNENKINLDSPGNEIMHNHESDYISHLAEAAYNPLEVDAFNHLAEQGSENVKPRKARQPRQPKSAKSPKGGKRGAAAEGGEGSSKQVGPELHDWGGNEQDLGGDRIDSWKYNSGLNQINFDESAMPVPVCSCTGVPQPCYKWGNGGWQSACCTTTISMYPLPPQGSSEKRNSRVGGRKMSGAVFNKLLNRMAAEGHDLYTPLDLKDFWSKHGTNRYSAPKTG